MRAVRETKIFGIRFGADPKILLGGLIALALILFWYNSRGEEEATAPVAQVSRTVSAPAPATRSRTRVILRGKANNDRGTLRLRPIDATQGDVDPTLRLDLLMRLQFVKPEESGRNLFEIGPAPLTPEQKALIANAPKIPPKPLPTTTPAAPSGPPPLNIPLKYYGFVKGGEKGEPNRGLFLDGDNVLVASEGETLKQRFLVVELRDTSARLEDVQVKRGESLPVVPVAMP